MGYKIRRLESKNRSWKVQFISYKSDREEIRDIPLVEYMQHGFQPTMSYDEAVARKDQLNSQSEEKRHAARKVRIHDRLYQESLAQRAQLPKVFLDEFEKKVLYESFYEDSREITQKSKVESHWRAAKRCLCELQVDPSEWADRKRAFYTYFAKKRISPSYLQKLIRLLNWWGKFISRKQGKFFDPLPFPKNYDRERIAEAYFEKPNADHESAPISPEQLKAQQATMDSELYNWLYISLWFGLRPKEIDSLHVPANFRIEEHQKIKVLFVRQSKLRSVAPEKRWKYIPCLHPEQVKALKIVMSGKFRRPSPKPIKARFGEKTNLYGGRKGFEFLMASLGHTLEEYSLWLGHRSIDRTWRNYKERQKVLIPKSYKETRLDS